MTEEITWDEIRERADKLYEEVLELGEKTRENQRQWQEFLDGPHQEFLETRRKFDEYFAVHRERGKTMNEGSYQKVVSVGAFNFTFTLFEDGSAEFKKGINPKESVYLNPDQVLDVYDDLTKFYQSSASKVRKC